MRVAFIFIADNGQPVKSHGAKIKGTTTLLEWVHPILPDRKIYTLSHFIKHGKMLAVLTGCRFLSLHEIARNRDS